MSDLTHAAEAELHRVGGFLHLEADWGRSRRGARLTDDQVRLIRSGTHKTDAIYAAQFGLSALSVRNVRLRQRYKNVMDCDGL